MLAVWKTSHSLVASLLATSSDAFAQMCLAYASIDQQPALLLYTKPIAYKGPAGQQVASTQCTA
jgi:hypothetical protein